MMIKKFFVPVLANLSAALAEILLMATAARLIASAALHPPLSALSLWITLVRAAGISRAGLRYADRFFSHKKIFVLLDELREKFFRHAAEKLPLKSGRNGAGDLLRTLTVKADLLKDFLPRVVLPIATGSLVMILLAGFLFSSIGIFAGILPGIFFADLILSALKKFDEPDDTDYRGKLLDFSDATDELKIYGTAPAIRKLNRAAENFSDEEFKIQVGQTNFDTAIKILNAAGICLVLLKLCEVADRIELTVWALILLAVLEIFAGIPAAVRTYKKIRAVRLGEEKNIPGEKNSSTTDFAAEFCAVDFGYNPAKNIFRNFNLQIRRGEKVAIVGESGAGKTTLLYLLTKLFVPDSGSVKTSGEVAAATFENFVFSESIRANFKILHENISDEEIFSALKISQLAGFDVDSPTGFDGANLSGGERVRLQIALAIAKNPDVLIADEPTAGLDKRRAENLIDALIEDADKKNRTLIIITHDLSIAKKFERVIRI